MALRGMLRSWVMRIAGLLLLLGGFRCAFAWGAEGHRLVARIAENLLTPAARAQVQAVLAPGEALSGLASWADEVRKSRQETEPWHFVDVPLGQAGFEWKRDCPQVNCVVAKISDFENIWRDASAGPAARREALLFLVHFVGDLHEPLHCADNHDKGGNDVAVNFFGETTKLHTLWDSGLLHQMPPEEDLFRTLWQGMTPAHVAQWSAGTADQWCSESFHVAETNVYGPLPSSASNGPLELGQAYLQQAEPAVEMQIERAGARLAAILNRSVP